MDFCNNSLSNPSCFSMKRGYTCHVLSGSIQALDQSKSNRIVRYIENNWNCCSRSLSDSRRNQTTTRCYRRNPSLDQILHQTGQAVILTIGKSKFQTNFATVDKSGFGKSLP